MKDRHGRHIGPVAALLVCWASSPMAQVTQGPGFGVDYESAELRLVPVAGNVYMLAGTGAGNMGVFVGPDGVVLVDDQFAPLTERIRQQIATVSEEPIRFLINTHFHGDHTGGNENLGAAGTVIIAHENVRDTLAGPHYIEMIDSHFAAFDPSGLPIVTFQDSVTLHLNGERVDVYHAPPSHTNGDSFIYFRGSDVLHMGDVFRSRGQPLFDRRNGGSFQGLIDAADRALSIIGDETRIIPGHGTISSRADLRQSRDVMITMRDRILEAIDAGLTVEETIDLDLSADLEWRDGPLTVDEVVEWIYLELASR